MPTTSRKAPRRIAQAVLSSLKGGVVPRVGLPYVTVGRKNEIAALLHDVDIIKEGGASCRFLVGRYGAGKSFLLQTMRNFVLERGFLVVDADLSPERRLTGTRGQGLATYRELMGNLATKTRPEGGALHLVLDRWVSAAETAAAQESGAPLGSPELANAVDQKILAVTGELEGMVHGFDFARLLTQYYHAYLAGDDALRGNVLRWFRGEIPTKSEAKNLLGVNLVITDDDWYDYLKLFARFFRLAGYAGLIVMLDELINLYKITNSVSRANNYEKLLTLYNDTLSGKAAYLGLLLSATPQALLDTRRGIFSYEALRSRLAEGKFSRPGSRDLLAPVIHLEPLTPEEMLVLTGKLQDLHANLYGYAAKLTDADLEQFVRLEYSRVGANENITPREVIRDFIEALDLLYQNPALTFAALLENGEFAGESAGTDGTSPLPSVAAENGKPASGYMEFTL